MDEISHRISSGIFRRAPCVWGREDRPDSRRSPDFPERGERERGPGEGKAGKKGEKRGNVTKPIRDGRLVVKGTERPKVRGEREKGRGETYE